MPKDQKVITRDDILDIPTYVEKRKGFRSEAVALKKNRRMEVGPYATFYFENYETMWHQIHEMLYIEKGGEEQIKDELSAFNPLIPQGRELICTMMLEIPDETRRNKILSQLGGIEDTITLKIGDEEISAVPEQDTERTTEEGKTSSVHFLHFPLTDAQAGAFKSKEAHSILTIDREGYQHMAIMPDAVCDALISDLD